MRWDYSTLAGLSLLAFSGCGSPQSEPNSSAETTTEEIAPPPAPAADANSLEDRSEQETADEPASPSAAPATTEDFREALQVVLQDDALLSQLNLEEPGRFPLKIAGKDLPTGVEVQTHAQNVEVVEAPADPAKEAVMVFTSIELDSASGTFKYLYEIEGLRGTTRVSKSDGRWQLQSSRISQY